MGRRALKPFEAKAGTAMKKSRQHGSEKVRDMFVDDIRQAQFSGDKGMC